MKLTKDHHIQLLVHCARGQTILIGNDIAIRVNCTYLRKQDKRSCVSLIIEAPWETSIYQTCIDQKKLTISSADNAWVPAENFLDANNDIKQAASSAAQAGTKKPRVSRKKSPAAHVMAEVLS